MKLSRQLTLALVASLFSVGSFASPVPPRSPLELIRYMHPRVSKCLLSREPKLIRDWFATIPGSSEEATVINRGIIRINACFGVNSDGSRFVSSYDFVRMRAGLVRAVLQTQREKIPEQAPSGFDSWKPQFDNGQPPQRALLAQQVSVCLVRNNWAEVRKMILAVDPKWEMRDNFSDKIARREIAAVDLELSRVIAGLPNCVPEKAKLTLARVELRHLLEEAALEAVGVDTLVKLSATRHGSQNHA